MPTITLNKKIFEKLIDHKLSAEKLKDRISYLGTDLEKIEEDNIYVEVFPNRPDMLSEHGFARALSSFIGVHPGLKKYDTYKSKHKVIIDKSVEHVRPYTACAIVKGLNFTDEKIKEVIQLQEKLHITYGRKRTKCAIGIYPFEKIKTPITYCAKNPKDFEFVPLEAKKKMNGLQILQQHPTGRDYAHLLESETLYPLFIDAYGSIMSMPPIINSNDVGKITEKTKDVFIECSGFDYRILSKCLNIIITALADMGGKIYSIELIYPCGAKESPDLAPDEMELDTNYVNKILGLKLTDAEVKVLLEKMGYGYHSKKAFIPAYRTDVMHQIDIIEDIAIAYGYETFKGLVPKVATIGKESDFEIFKRKISEILAGLGLIDVKTFHLGNIDDFNKRMLMSLDLITLANSISSDYSVLRQFMLPSLMCVLKNNRCNEFPQNCFDIGRVFKKNKNTETGVEEIEKLAVVVSHAKVDFTELKQIFDYLMRMLGIDFKMVETEHSSFIKGRAAMVSVGAGISEKKLAYIGEISPQVLSNFELEMPVAGFELNLTELFEMFKQ